MDKLTLLSEAMENNTLSAVKGVVFVFLFLVEESKKSMRHH